ncbi:pyridoxal-phosphate dependent enzyme [Dactylosporangium aurantiacum]|uniref:pyridoxal-phosphate dependent enzyme n=1 Tax=Dactylosporangium aurantiacum TaxID=35754 RepID=UPI001FE00E6A|nr:pyridoxal-phosphate dependent enzyme [Dactylosporangium aurantiacum]MDG6106542.1 pyridoxal-phosphate dependent enzyme [Dactylosporangium aurantiacum]
MSAWPTPMEAAARLATHIGLAPDDLWIKRDDLTGLGVGGNKVRKLEWLVADALHNGADTLVTTGGPQSNHARLTAAAAARTGLRVTLVMPAAARPPQPTGNLLLDAALGARIIWADATGPADLTTHAQQVCTELRAQGATPYLVPFGGSNALGARGYHDAGIEILHQQPTIQHVVTALGSGATMAGLVAALGTERVLGIDVGALPDPAAAAATYATELTGNPVTPARLRVRHDQIGAGYGTLHEPVLDAITTVARAEGVILDPVYTGRAAAGLIAAVHDGTIRPGQRTVLLHTGGLPGLFGHSEATHRITHTTAP